MPSLRLANLAALRHPYSVDLYIEKVLSKARFVLVRLLGGMDYWRYGVDELATLARSSGFHLAIVPGDHRDDARLDEASTLQPEALRRIWSYFAAGGVANIGACLDFVAGLCVRRRCGLRQPSSPVPPFGCFDPATRPGAPGAPSALIVFYRAWMLAADTDPVVALAQDLATRGFRVAAVYVTSLKDEAVAVPLRAHLQADRPDIILNLTAFSARLGYRRIGAGPGGCAGFAAGPERRQPYAMDGLAARSRTGRPRDERRPARVRRPDHRRRDFLQGRDAAQRRAGVHPAGSPARAGWRFSRRRSGVRLGEARRARRGRNGASPASCPTIPRRPGAPAMPSGSTRRAVSSPSPAGWRGKASRSSRPTMKPR